MGSRLPSSAAHRGRKDSSSAVAASSCLSRSRTVLPRSSSSCATCPLMGVFDSAFFASFASRLPCAVARRCNEAPAWLAPGSRVWAAALPRPSAFASAAFFSALFLRRSALASASAPAPAGPAPGSTEAAFAGVATVVGPSPSLAPSTALCRPLALPLRCTGFRREARTWRSSSVRVVMPCLCAESRSFRKTLRNTNWASDRPAWHAVPLFRSSRCKPLHHVSMNSPGTAISSVRSWKSRLKQHQGGSSITGHLRNVDVTGP
mmetsp:Transcript_62728/g.187003  ORF Transcript_62728/g.187003 Transcript_62728/m.187003 type:complete len:262 (+) Transcript_62728:344-1129(+)